MLLVYSFLCCLAISSIWIYSHNHRNLLQNMIYYHCKNTTIICFFAGGTAKPHLLLSWTTFLAAKSKGAKMKCWSDLYSQKSTGDWVCLIGRNRSVGWVWVLSLGWCFSFTNLFMYLQATYGTCYGMYLPISKVVPILLPRERVLLFLFVVPANSRVRLSLRGNEPVFIDMLAFCLLLPSLFWYIHK